MTFDPTAVEAWLERVYSDAPGLLSVVYAPKGRPLVGGGSVVPTAAAALERITKLEGTTPQGIYLRTTTLTRQPERGRGDAADSLALPGLWADVDFGTEGHKPGAGDRLPLPPDEDAARAIVTTSGLPAPSLWVHSGGGLYPWWLLDQPAILDDTTRPQAADVSAQWQQALKRSAERLGYEYGAGVGDLPRVLRIPGTVNRKTDTDRPCRVIEDTGTAYTLDELLAGLTAATPAPAPQPAPTPRTRDVLQLHTGTSAFDTLDAHVTFDDVLTGAGWTRHDARHSSTIEQCWTRPGDPDSPCSAHTLTANPHVLVVFSELAGLPTGGGRALTRGRVFAHLHHGGDERAAAVDIFAAIGGRASTPAAAALPLPRSTMPPSTYGLGDLGEHDVTTQQRQREQAQHEPPPAPPAEHDEQQTPPDTFERDVADRVRYLQVVETAQRRHDEAKHGDRPTVFARDGADFILDSATDTVPAIWGHGSDVGWSEGEPLMIVGGPGVGKTTLAGQLLEARLGIGTGRVLDLPVKPTASKVLYLAMDRPQQIQRALARILGHEDLRDTLHDRLVFWPGPPPADVALDTDALARLAYEHGADTIVVDSLKDAVLGLAEDGPAAAYNRARQTAIAAGVEILELHHDRKNGSNGGKTTALSDVYGSRWLTAGAGSVIALNGDAGDAVVDLRHLKQPAESLGPWQVIHDATAGRSSIFHATDLLALTRGNGDITAKDAAKALYETDKPSANEVEKARRRILKLESDGRLIKVVEGDKTTSQATRWALADDADTPSRTPSRTHPERDPITDPSPPSRKGSKPHHDPHHGHHAAGPSRPHTPLEGVGVSPKSSTTNHQRAYIAGREQWIDTDTGTVHDQPPTQQESA